VSASSATGLGVWSRLREWICHIVIRGSVRGLILAHDSRGIVVVLLSSWYTAEPTRVEVFMPLVARLRLLALRVRGIATVVEAIGPEHDHLVVAFVVLANGTSIPHPTVRSDMTWFVR